MPRIDEHAEYVPVLGMWMHGDVAGYNALVDRNKRRRGVGRDDLQPSFAILPRVETRLGAEPALFGCNRPDERKKRLEIALAQGADPEL